MSQGITTIWDDAAHTVIRMELHKGWRWDDLRAAVQTADEWITSVPHRVGIIIDLRAAGGLPGDFMSAAGELLASGEARPNEGHKVIIGANWVLRGAYQAFLRVYGAQMAGRPLRFAATIEEARQLVHQE